MPCHSIQDLLSTSSASADDDQVVVDLFFFNIASIHRSILFVSVASVCLYTPFPMHVSFGASRSNQNAGSSLIRIAGTVVILDPGGLHTDLSFAPDF